MKFAMFFMAEYANMITVSCVATLLFFGGATSPSDTSSFRKLQSGLVEAIAASPSPSGEPLRMDLQIDGLIAKCI
jgi:hypothetical protein